jgi:putative sterol carrier protein
MADTTRALFKALAERGQQPLLRSISGTLRFDLKDGERTEHWYVTVNKGDVTVTQNNVPADCALQADKALFEGMASGTVNAMAATLRGDITVDGHVGLLLEFQRLLPGPQGPPGARLDKEAKEAQAEGAQ